MTRALLAFSVVFTALIARADYGEIDLLVHESIRQDFYDNHKRVNTEKLEYVGQPRVAGDKMSIDTRVWGEENMLGGWGWHNCTTSIVIKSRGVYEDLGTDCFFDWE